MSETDKIRFELDQWFSSCSTPPSYVRLRQERMLRTAPSLSLSLPIFLFSFLFIPSLLHTRFISRSFDLPLTNILSKPALHTVHCLGLGSLRGTTDTPQGVAPGLCWWGWWI